ncbi:LarC family nickel insertion protein [Starkeya sp. ORNL1]|nr:LarC family nickel insertion protein [Starkeya sp. ORNL1]
MFVAAMLDAFPQLGERVFADLAKVLPKDAGRPLLAEGSSGAVRCLRFGLEAMAPHGHHHHHGQESHSHPHHHHGRYRDLVARIEAAGLSDGTAAHAGAILRHIAEAEAHIHRVALDDVHFHELADWDSLMDVVAAGSIAAALTGTRWSVSELPRGGGMVRTQHGLLPVPAPATVEILQGFAWRDDGIGGERVTPTGAAILRHLVTGTGKAEGRLEASGTGAGTRDLPGMPNILRVLAFAPASLSHDRVAVLSFDIDDMTGEEIGVAADRLRALDGVRDLAISALIGKKGRPLHGFRLLVAPEALDAVKERCLDETSTIGLRWHFEERDLLERRGETRRDGETAVRVKQVRRPGRVSVKVESDDLASLDGLTERRAVKERLEGSEK